MAAPKKPNGGRPGLDITPEVWKEICDRIAAGESVRKVLKSNKEKYPQWDRFRKEKDSNEQYNAQYVKAIQDKGEMEVCDIEEICEELKLGKIDASSANVIIQAKKWKAAKFYPKMYGDKLDLTTKDEKIGGDSIDYSKLSDSVLKAIIEAKKPDDSD